MIRQDGTISYSILFCSALHSFHVIIQYNAPHTNHTTQHTTAQHSTLRHRISREDTDPSINLPTNHNPIQSNLSPHTSTNQSNNPVTKEGREEASTAHWKWHVDRFYVHRSIYFLFNSNPNSLTRSFVRLSLHV